MRSSDSLPTCEHWVSLMSKSTATRCRWTARAGGPRMARHARAWPGLRTRSRSSRRTASDDDARSRTGRSVSNSGRRCRRTSRASCSPTCEIPAPIRAIRARASTRRAPSRIFIPTARTSSASSACRPRSAAARVGSSARSASTTRSSVGAPSSQPVLFEDFYWHYFEPHMESPVYFMRPICAERGGRPEHLLHPLVHPSRTGAAGRAAVQHRSSARPRSRRSSPRPTIRRSTSTWSFGPATSSCSRTRSSSTSGPRTRIGTSRIASATCCGFGSPRPTSTTAMSNCAGEFR